MRRGLAATLSGMVRDSRAVFSYGLVVMALTHTLTHVFTRVHTALFPILQDEFSLSLQQLGLIAAIPPLCATLFSIPAGLLSDRFGSRKLVLLSLVVASGGALMASQTVTPVMLIVAVSLLYINTTIYHPAAYSFVTRLFDPRGRLKALGIHGAAGTLGAAIGPISISVIMGLLGLGWRAVYLLWLAPLLFGIIAVFRLRSEPVEDVPVYSVKGQVLPQATSLLSASLVLFLVFIGVRVVANSMSQSFIALYLVDERGLSESAASFLVGLNILVGIVAAPIGGFLAVRYGEKRWLLTVLGLAYVCFGLAFVVPNNVAFMILYVAYGFLAFLGMAADSAIMARLSPGRQRGLAFALFFLPGSIVGAVAPLLAASIADRYGLTSIFYVSIVVFFISLGVLGFGVKVPTQDGHLSPGRPLGDDG